MKKNARIEGQAGKSVIILIFIIVLIDSIGLGIIYPILPALITTLTGKGLSGAAELAGLLTASYAVMQFIFAPIVGSLSDQHGRRPILMLCMAGFFVDYLFLAVAHNIQLLFAGEIIAGIFGASYTAASAYMGDIANDETRAKYFGLLNAAYGLGLVIGPVIGGLLGGINVRMPFLFAAVLSLICALLVYFFLPESLAKKNRRPFSWKTANPIGAFAILKKYTSLRRLLIAFFIIYVASYVVMSTWAFFTAEKFQWSRVQIGLSLSVFGLLIAIVQYFGVSFFSKKFGDWKTIRLGIVFYLIGMLMFAFTNHVYILYLAMIPYCLGGIVMPAIQSYFFRHR